jgi:hypothetical protein
VDLVYQPQPKQEGWHACSAYESGFGGAKFGGKSLALVMEATRYTWHPRYRGIIFRRTYPRLEELLDRAKQWYPGLGAVCTDGKDWVFPSGAKILFRHCQSEDDKRAYHGHEYQFMGFDQLEEFTQTQYVFLLGQNRTGVADLVPYVRSTFNPGGVGHGWVKERFIEHGSTDCPPWTPVNDVGDDLQSRCFHFANIDDNRLGEEADPHYRQRLGNLAEADRRALLAGDWEVFAGQFFGEWRRELHTCEPFDLPAHWTTRGYAVDWGYGAPWSVHFYVRDEDLWASHKLERWYAYRELYATKVDDEDQADRIKAAREADEQVVKAKDPKARLTWATVADPSMWNNKPNSNHSAQQAYAGRGVHLTKANNDRVAGWARLRSFLRAHRVLSDGKREPLTPDGKPLLLFMRERCPHAIRTLPALVYDERNVEDINQDPGVEDHCADEIRYWLMSRGDPRLVLMGRGLPMAMGGQVRPEKAPVPSLAKAPAMFPAGWLEGMGRR